MCCCRQRIYGSVWWWWWWWWWWWLWLFRAHTGQDPPQIEWPVDPGAHNNKTTVPRTEAKEEESRRKCLFFLSVGQTWLLIRQGRQKERISIRRLYVSAGFRALISG
ncbi:hypothetical protein QBC42DRAFT_38323 [Cladorrhinum samala]|uniref:Secreted protein n=1 Tax=Cladorrhinum samala TaxID=585594 RepID=A0AAV9H9Y2_9PEZI|nr:hypothetical protein QBC42DRAFT_38323 [Cladorrhinum samala]